MPLESKETLDETFCVVSVAENVPQPLSACLSGQESVQVDANFQRLASGPLLFVNELMKRDSLYSLGLRELQQRMVGVVLEDECVASVSVALEPYKFRAKKKDFAHRVSREVVGRLTNFVHSDLLPENGYHPIYRNWDWYKQPKLCQQSKWSRPFLDQESGNLPLISYSVPIMKQGEFIGVVKMDCLLDREMVKGIKPISMGTEGKEEAIKEYLGQLAQDPQMLTATLSTFRQLGIKFVEEQLKMLITNSGNSSVNAAWIYCRRAPAGANVSRKEPWVMHIQRQKDDPTQFVVDQPPAEPFMEARSFCEDALDHDKSAWSSPYVPHTEEEDESEEEMLSTPPTVTYAAPFRLYSRRRRPFGLVCLDVIYDDGLRSKLAKTNTEILCQSCDLDCQHCYYRNQVSLTRTYVCLRCFTDGILPSNMPKSDFELVKSQTYSEFIERYRRPADIHFGQHIQLLHVKSGNFLSVGLKKEESEITMEPPLLTQPSRSRQSAIIEEVKQTEDQHELDHVLYGARQNAGSSKKQYFSMELEQPANQADPYLEGSESTYFTVLPSSDVRSVGEIVREGDQIRLVSTRWQWECQFEEAPDAVTPNVVDFQPTSHGGGHSLSAVQNWKVVPVCSLDTFVVPFCIRKGWITSSGAAKQETLLRTYTANVVEDMTLALSTLEQSNVSSPYLRHGDFMNLHASTSTLLVAVLGDRSAPTSKNPVGKVTHRLSAIENGLDIATNKPASVLECVFRLELVPPPAEVNTFDEDTLPCDVVTWKSVIQLRHVLSGRLMAVGKCVDETELEVPETFASTTVGAEDEEKARTGLTLHPVNAAGMDLDSPMCMDDPFYVACSFDGEDYWLNIAGTSALFTTNRDEEDSFIAQRVKMDHQKGVFSVLHALQHLDEFIEKMNKCWPKKIGAVSKTPGHQQRDTLNAFLAQMFHDFESVNSQLRQLCRFLAVSGNNPNADISKLIDHPAHDAPGETGLAIEWRQKMLEQEHLPLRLFCILRHPVFQHLLAMKRTGASSADVDSSDSEEEKEDATQKTVMLRQTSERFEEETKMREAALNVFRIVTNLGCLMMTDNEDAAVACATEENLDLLLGFCGSSAFNRLGAERYLTLMVESAREVNPTLSISTPKLQNLIHTWGKIIFSRQKLREKGTSVDLGNKLTRRHLTTHDRELHSAAVALLRLFSTLTKAADDPYPLHQEKLLEQLVAEAEKMASSRGVRREMSTFSTTDMKVVEAKVTVPPREARSTTLHSIKWSNFDAQSLQLVCDLCMGAARTGGFNLVVNSHVLGELLGLPMLDLSITSLLDEMENSANSFNARARYCDMIHFMYVEQRYKKRIVDMTPYLPPMDAECTRPRLLSSIAQTEKIVPKKGGLKGIMRRAFTFKGRKIQEEEEEEKGQDLNIMFGDPKKGVSSVGLTISKKDALRLWDFAMVYLGLISDAERNCLTESVLKMVHSLILYHYRSLEDILEGGPDEEDVERRVRRLMKEAKMQSKQRDGRSRRSTLAEVGQSGRLSKLSIILVRILGTSQERGRTGSDEEWDLQVQSLLRIKVTACEVLNTMMEYRLQQHMNGFFELSAVDKLFQYYAEMGGHMQVPIQSDPVLEQPEVSDPMEMRGNSFPAQTEPGSQIELMSRLELGYPINKLKRPHRRSQLSIAELESYIFSPQNDIMPQDFDIDGVLLNIIEKSESPDLVMWAFALLQRQRTQAAELQKNMEYCLIIREESTLLQAERVVRQLADLEYILDVELEVDSDAEVDVALLKKLVPKIVEILDSFAIEFMSSEEYDAGLVAHHLHRVRSDVVRPDVNVNQALRSSFKTTQDLFRLLGLHQGVLSVLRMELDEDVPLMRHMFDLCFGILVLFAHDNEANKKKLEKQLSVIYGQLWLGPSPSILLMNLVSGNLQLCSRVPKRVLEKYLDFMNRAAHKSWMKSAVPLHLLKELVRVEGKLVPLNQKLIVTTIVESPNILGLLGRLSNAEVFQRLVEVLNYVPVAAEPSLALVKGGLNEDALLVSKQYYIELISLLTRCAPNNIMYVGEASKRESAEGAQLIQAALPFHHMVALICAVTDSSIKITLMHFIQEVFGPQAMEKNRRSAAKLLRDCQKSVDLVANYFQNTRVPSSDEEKNESVDAATISSLFSVTIPFLISYYHSNFSVEEVSESELRISNNLFISAVHLARELIHRARYPHNTSAQVPTTPQSRKMSFCAESVIAISETRGFGIDVILSLLLHMHNPDGDMVRSSGVRGNLRTSEFWELIDKLKEAQNHVLDAAAENVRDASCVSGFSSSSSEEESDVALLARRERMKDWLVKQASRFVPAKKATVALNKQLSKRQKMASMSTMAVAAPVPTKQEDPLKRWVLRMRKRLNPRCRREIGEFTAVFEQANEELLRKTILLVGEFGRAEVGHKHLSGNEFIDDNSSGFCINYLRVLLNLMAKDVSEDDHVRKRMVELSLPQILVGLISRSYSLKVSKMALLVANRLLEGGFHLAQTAFKVHLEEVADNVFFSKLRELLRATLRVRTKSEVEATGQKFDPERFGSWPLVERVLRFLQLLCEGHNLDWQRMLCFQALGSVFGSRDEEDVLSVMNEADSMMGSSVNLVAQAVDFLFNFVSESGPLWNVIVYWDHWYDTEVMWQVLEVIKQVLNTLTEVCQGPCVINQVELTKGRFIEAVNWLLDAIRKALSHRNDVGYGTWAPLEVTKEKHLDRTEVLLELQELLAVACNAMLEGDVPEVVPSRVMAVMSFDKIRDLMTNYYELYEQHRNAPVWTPLIHNVGVQEMEKENPFSKVCVNWYIFVRTLISRFESAHCHESYSTAFMNLLNSPTFSQVESKFERMVGSVEILRDGHLETMLFRIPHIVLHQSNTPSFKERQAEVIYDVRRENQHAKLDDLLQASDEMIYELTSHPKLKQSWTVRLMPAFLNVTFALAFLLNIFSVIYDDEDDKAFMRIFGIMQVVFSVCRIVSYTCSQAPLHLYRYVKQVEAELLMPANYSEEAIKAAVRAGMTVVEKKKDEKSQEKEESEDESEKGGEMEVETGYGFSKISTWQSIVWMLTFAFWSSTLYHLLYIIAAIVGLFYPVAYCYHLFDIVSRSALLKNVLKALRSYMAPLAATGFLWLVLIYISSAVTFAFFKNDLSPDDVRMTNEDDTLETTCTTKWQCMMTMVTSGLFTGGGVHEMFNAAEWDTKEYYWRSLFEIFYFLILVIVMLAIVSGIIIDAFGASRDERQEVEEDQSNICFICGQESSRFETKKGFEWHYKNEHNMWQYIYLLAYIRIKDSTEYTGQESYVQQQASEGQISFFPIDRSIMLEWKP